MEIRVDRQNPIPVGVQVKEQIKMQIHAGMLKEGGKLTSISLLASELNVNKNTIVSVYKALEQEGYIESFRGKGIFVKKGKEVRSYTPSLISNLDRLIQDAKKYGMDANDLVNLVSARFYQATAAKQAKILFVMGFSRELLDVNLQKLRQSITGAEFEGLFVSKDLGLDRIQEGMRWADIIAVPAAVYPAFQGYLPPDKPIIKTLANLRLFNSLRKGIQKKSKIAVIGISQNEAQAISEIFTSSGYFRPKLALSIQSLEKAKKDLKEMDVFVICISAREAVEKLKIKDREIYFFSDYIDEDSLEQIRLLSKRFRK